MPRHVRSFALALCLLAGLPAMTAHASEGGEAAAPAAGPAVLKIKPVMLPVTTASGAVEKYAQMEVTLELSGGMTAQEAQAAQPRVQAAILDQIYKAIDAGLIVRGAIANAGVLRKKLGDAAEGILGKGTVGRVLIAPASRQSAWP